MPVSAAYFGNKYTTTSCYSIYTTTVEGETAALRSKQGAKAKQSKEEKSLEQYDNLLVVSNDKEKGTPILPTGRASLEYRCVGGASGRFARSAIAILCALLLLPILLTSVKSSRLTD